MEMSHAVFVEGSEFYQKPLHLFLLSDFCGCRGRTKQLILGVSGLRREMNYNTK